MNHDALYIANLVAYFLIYICFTLGLNVSFGMSGILDFAFVTFMAVGAYVGGVFALGPEQAGSGINYVLGLHAPWPIGLLAGAAAASALGVLVGLVAVRRLRSDYMAIALVAVWTVAWDVVGNERGLFNGQAGIVSVPQPFASVFHTNPNNYVYVFIGIALLIGALLTFIAWAIQESSYGMALRAIREDQDAAAAFGKSVLRYRLKAMAIACAYAGVGGALTVEFIGGMNPSAWAIVETVIIFSALLLGGRGNVWGAILGALVVRVIIIEGTSLVPGLSSHPAIFGAARNILLGALLIIVLYFRPQGLLPEPRRRYFVDASAEGPNAHRTFDGVESTQPFWRRGGVRRGRRESVGAAVGRNDIAK